MQTTFNPYMSNNQVNFRALKKVNGVKELSGLIEDGALLGNDIVQSLRANKLFNTLCEKYDVFVNIEPMCRFDDILLKKGLLLEIFAQKIDKSFLGIFKKKEKLPVASYMPFGTEARTWDLAEYMKKNYISAKNGLEKDICDFMKE